MGGSGEEKPKCDKVFREGSESTRQTSPPCCFAGGQFYPGASPHAGEPTVRSTPTPHAREGRIGGNGFELISHTLYQPESHKAVGIFLQQMS